MTILARFGTRLGATIALAAACGLPAVADDSWPCFRGPTHDNHASAKRLPTHWSEQQGVAWKTAIHGRGWSSPVVHQGRVWLTTASEDGKQMSVVCLRADDGAVLHDKQIFANAEPRFRHAMNSYASPTPLVEDGRVFVHFGSYGTACLDAETAAVLWQRRDLPCDHFRGPGSSPISYDNLLIIHYDGFDLQYVAALDKASGRTVWKQDRDIDFGTDNGDIFKAYCTPLVIEVAGVEQLISPASKAAIAYDPRSGKEIWRVRYNEFSATAQPLFDGQTLYLNTGFGKAQLLAVRPDGRGDVTDTHVRWQVKKTIGSKPSQLLVGGLIYNVHDKGVASCIEAATGKELWTKRLRGQFSASPLYGAGHIYLLNHEGDCWVLKAGREYAEVAVNRLDTGGLASPAVVGNSLLIRTSTHLYRIDP